MSRTRRGTGLAIAASAVVWSVAWSGHAQPGDARAPDAGVASPSETTPVAEAPSTEPPSTEEPSTASAEEPSTEPPRTEEPSTEVSADVGTEAAETNETSPVGGSSEPPTARPSAPTESEPRARRPSGGPNHVVVHRDAQGFKLRVDGRDFMVFGMNWDFFPIGENYAYDFWRQPEAFIREALDYEMGLMRDMGVNAIRVYVGIPQRWIRYIYENFGIYTILNHPMGRYGHSVDGVWRSPTDYSDQRTREVLLEEIQALVRSYADTPGLLMWLLGNENNYGLYWASAEVENLPAEQRDDARATYLYSLFGQAIDVIHARDTNHPVAIANGDLQFLDVIREQCPNLDVMGSNVYRGASSRDLFDRVAEVLDVPFVYTEFGSDAFDAREGREDDVAQAEILVALWQEIYEHAYGRGRAQNAIGGMIFQWSDGWWKYQQETNLDVHDETASWSNAAYPFDYVEGQNNMNEEWFGLCAKGRPDEDGQFRLYCRSAYYALQRAFELDPYAPSTTMAEIREHFGSIRTQEGAARYAAQGAMSRLDAFERVRIAFLRLDTETYTTGGRRLNEPERQRTRFDHQESFYVGVEVRPTSRVRGSLTLNVLGNTAQNPIDEIYYERRGLPRSVVDTDGEEVSLSALERVAVYQASFTWDESRFQLTGFYRVGQSHWGHDGDFFHLVPETHYQRAVDQFDADVPIGVRFEGRRELEGLRIAFGPQLWWGANPTLIGMYHREWGAWEASVMHQEDLAQRAAGPTSSAIPTPRDRKTTLYLSRRFGPLRVELGGIMAGSPRVGQRFQAVRDAEDGAPSYLDSGHYVIDDEVHLLDTLGGKAKLTLEAAPFYWYLQGGYRGLVADAGWDPTVTITGWSLKESGQGNHWAVSTGAGYTVGRLQIAPNFLMQRPLEGPLPAIGDRFDPVTGIYYPGLDGRNQLQDPFWVRSNRETYGFELLLAYDPTPATWMWAWDNDRREDANFAAALDFTYRIHPTIQDSSVGVTAEGIQFAFPTSAPAQDLWDVRLRSVINFSDRARLVNTFYVGNGQANGDDPRLVYRAGAEGRLTVDRVAMDYFFRFGDWGPFDYYRDFNSTFPFQGMIDLSYSLSRPQWFIASYTRLGVRATYRLLDENSGRFLQDTTRPNAFGSEWEVRTYVQISI
ncbi:MAG: hypothetical protein MUE69_07265 [Myxococcota bacterium]|nr:hypothetical protein [Myxococcota bacterium]